MFTRSVVASLPDVLRSAMTGTATPALGAVVIQDGTIADAKALGLRRIGGPEQVQSGDAWMIGSCAKLMTTALIAGLVERGRLSWTAPLAKMLPDLAQAMQPVYRPVTLVQLLSHQSGLPKGDDLLRVESFADHRPLMQQRLDFLAIVLKQPAVSAPGTALNYSSAGFIAAAAIAEREAGTYEDLMQYQIFEPLGMFSAVFGQPGESQFSGHRGGRPAELTDSAPAFYNPAGLLRVRLQDWAKFCLDQLAGAKGNGKLLSPASYHLMQNPLPGFGNEALTWGFAPSIGGRKGPVLRHTGSDGNWYARVDLFPASGDGILLAANAAESMGGVKAADAAFNALLPAMSTPA
jgi:CubicO group peptidase (beta-lactamase class C family)